MRKNEFARSMAALMILEGARKYGIDETALLEAAGYDASERRAAQMTFDAMERAARARG